MKLRKDPNFWHEVYAEFCLHLEGELPSVVRAMVRESLAGSTQAGRLILEWAGKLNKTLNVNVSSPFEKWLAMEGKTMEDAEVVVDFFIGEDAAEDVIPLVLLSSKFVLLLPILFPLPPFHTSHV